MPLIGIAITVVALFAAGLVWTIARSSRWPSTDGVILKSVLREIYRPYQRPPNESIERIEYEASIEYEYHAEGVRYTSTRILAGVPNVLPREQDARAWVERFPEGQHTQVYYDPKNPSTACLIHGGVFSPAAYAILVFFIVLAIALVGGAVLLISGKLDLGSSSNQHIEGFL